MSNTKELHSILFVEDEKDIRDNYIKYLKRHFTDVYEAADGEEGFKIYKEKKPDIMIVDINLPKLDGLELVKKIREVNHTIKVIMLTAHSETKYLLEATELKLTKYLIKPISRSELKDSLNLAIGELSKFDVTSKKIVTLKDKYTWDSDREELLHENSSIPITNKERKILALFFSSPNITYSYDAIVGDIWDSYDDDKVGALKTIIKNLRKKLPKDCIKNVFGIGYKIQL